MSSITSLNIAWSAKSVTPDNVTFPSTQDGSVGARDGALEWPARCVGAFEGADGGSLGASVGASVLMPGAMFVGFAVGIDGIGEGTCDGALEWPGRCVGASVVHCVDVHMRLLSKLHPVSFGFPSSISIFVHRRIPSAWHIPHASAYVFPSHSLHEFCLHARGVVPLSSSCAQQRTAISSRAPPYFAHEWVSVLGRHSGGRRWLSRGLPTIAQYEL